MFISYAQNGEDAMLWRCLKDIRNGFYIDVGAYDPNEDSVTRAFYDRGWRGINIEPGLDAYNRLKTFRPWDKNLNVAVGSVAGQADFYYVEGTGLSTIDPEQADVYRAEGMAVVKRTVPVSTLADICERLAVTTIHFLKIDCECSESICIEGADFKRFRPWIVLVESTIPRTQISNHEQWEPQLIAAGYRFVWFDGLNRFYVSNEQYERLSAHFETPLNIFDNYLKTSAANTVANKPLNSPFMISTPDILSDEQRIEMTMRCRDADGVPKVADAGEVVDVEGFAPAQIMHNGLKVPADAYYGAWMTKLIRNCRGHHEPQEERMFYEVVRTLPPDATMLEVGGFWSYYSAWFLLGNPGRRAIVVEPDPKHIGAGRQTMALNGLRAEFVSAFVGGDSGEPTPFQTEESGVLTLPRLSVPDLLASKHIDFLDVLHCDAQGVEFDVIQSCSDLFKAGRVKWLFVSTHAQQITSDPLTHQRCLALLVELGATIEAEHDVHESFSGDGLIVARFGAPPADWKPVRLSYNRYSKSLFPNPAYLLAARMAAPVEQSNTERLVDAVYRTLLLRPADPGGLKAHSELLRKPEGMQTFINLVLSCAEFQGNLDQFASCYFNLDAPFALQSFRRGAAMDCSGLNLRLKSDGPLGTSRDRLTVPADKVILPSVMQHGSWSADEVSFIASRLRNDIDYHLVDIGANVGLFSRELLLSRSSVKSAYCVEPDAENFSALKANLTMFGDRALNFFNFGLGAHDGPATFFRDRENIGNYSFHPDAMRNRPFDAASVEMVSTSRWMTETLGGVRNIVWKSDTQGHDEIVVGGVPWNIWENVEAAMIELWRIDKGHQTIGDFLDKVDMFPNKRIGLEGAATTAEVETYLRSTDWAHSNLFLWK